MKNLFRANAWSRFPELREHLLASGLATGLFLLVFGNAILGGQHYGELPQQQLTGVIWQYPRIGDPTATVAERQPNIVDPDYHFLYELDAEAAARDLKAGHLPYFDFSRMLGVPLWGSVVFDFGNPLNLLLAFISSYGVHLIKVLVCMLTTANGFVILMRELGAKTSTAWVVATLLYLGSNYALYWIHFITAYGVICIAPMLLGTMLWFLRTGSAGSFLSVFASVCFVVVAHYTHIAVHLLILCAVAVLVTVLLSRQDWKVQLGRVAMLGFAGICAAVACAEILWQVQVTAADSGRVPARYIDHGYPIITIPVVPEAYSTYFFGNISTGGSYWEALFLPWAAVLCVVAVFALTSQTRRREIRVMGWLLAFFAVFFFIGFLDIPLYWMLGKLYAPNPMAWRGMVNLYVPVIALAGLGAEMLIAQPPPRIIRIAAKVGLALVVFLGIAALWRDSNEDFVRRTVFNPSGAFFDSYVRTLSFWLVLGGNALWLVVILLRIKSSAKAAWTMAGAAAVCLGMSWSRVPTYPASEIAHVVRGDAANINTPRVARLVPGTEYLLGAAKVEMRYVLDSPLSTLGLKMLNGYHSSMSSPELKVFDSLVSDQYIRARDGEAYVLRAYSFAFYRTFLDGRAIVKDNAIRPDKALVLKLLGVDFVIDGASLSRVDRDSIYDFSKWPGVNLQVTTASHLVEGMGLKDVLALFSGTLDPERVATMAGRLRPLTLEPLAKDQGYEAKLNGTAGTLIVPYHFGRWFKVTLDGQPVSEPDGWGLCAVEVTPQNKVLEIRPRRDGILARTFGGLISGCLLALLGCGLCKRLGNTNAARGGDKPVRH